MRPPQGKRRAGRTGGAILEFSLGSTLLTLFFFGTIDLGRVYQAALEVDGASSAGAIFASTSLANSSNESGIIAAARADASSLGASLGIAVQQICQNASGSAVACTQAGARQYVQVTVSYPFETLFRFPLVPSSIALSKTTLMRVK